MSVDFRRIDEELLDEIEQIEAASPMINEMETFFCQETLNNIKSEFEIDDENEKDFKILLSLAEDYDNKNIFFIGAFGIFYSHNLHKPEIQDSVCSDGSQSETRITVLISTSVSGEEKMPVMIVSSAKSIQSFQNVRNIFVKFCQEPRSWITVTNLKEHLNLLDKQFEKQERKVLFLADKSIPRHLNIDQNLKNIKLASIPHSTQSPFQSGIVNRIKSSYRAKIVKNPDTDLSLNGSVTLLVETWKDIQADLILSCCTKTKLFTDIGVQDNSTSTEMDELLDKPAGFDEFVNCDNFLFTHDPICVEMENNPNLEMEFKQEFSPIKINIGLKHHSRSEICMSEQKRVKIDNENESSVVIVEISEDEDETYNANVNNQLSILEQVVLICIQQNKILSSGYIDDESTIEEILAEATSHFKFSWPSSAFRQRWFNEFVEKHSIKFNTKPEVDPTWINLILEQEVTKQFESEDVFFVGEFAFYYNLHPSKDSVIPRKKLSVMMGVNLRGSKKLPLFIIGSEESPVVSLSPTQYMYSPDANVKKIMFQKYLESLNMSATKNSKKLLVFCDHFLIHLIPTYLHKNILLRLLPPTIISPIEQLTSFLKYNYRQKFIKNEHHQDNQEIQMVDAMNFITDIWKSLKVSFINAMLEKSGWKSVVIDQKEISNEDMGKVYDPAVEFNFQLIDYRYDYFMDFVQEDDNLPFSKVESIPDICKTLKFETKANESKTKAAQNLKSRLENQLNIMKNLPLLLVRPKPKLVSHKKKVSTYSSLSASILSKLDKPEIPPSACIPASDPEDNILKKFNMNNLADSPYPFHDLGVIKWIEFAKNNNIEITNLILRVKAQKIAEKLCIKGFIASKKWLQRFKMRHAVDDEFLLSKTMMHKDVGEQMEINNGFAFCIFPLFYKSTPQQCTLRIQKVLGSSGCNADEYCDERFTIMFCANKAGEKLPLVVIGQRKISENSFLKHQQVLKYLTHPNSIMTKTLFESQMISIDRKFQYEKRKVHFIVTATDHCSPSLQMKLKNIKLHFLNVAWPKTTLLPLEGAFVDKFKSAYRSVIVERETLALLNNYEAEPINTFEALAILHDVYQKIGKTQLLDAFSSTCSTNGTTTCANHENTVQNFNSLNENFDDFDDFIRFDDNAPTSSSHNKDQK